MQSVGVQSSKAQGLALPSCLSRVLRAQPGHHWVSQAWLISKGITELMTVALNGSPKQVCAAGP